MSANKIMVAATVAIVVIGCLLLTGCGTKDNRVRPVDTVDVALPILEDRPAPEELKFKPWPEDQLPLWVEPTNPAATSCLTPDGEAKRRAMDADVVGKVLGWEKWGVLP